MPKLDWAIVLPLIIILLIAGVSSCREEGPVRLSRTDNQLIDSIFFSKKDSLIKLTDSLCNERYPAQLAQAIDSIKQIRREEIESILSRR